MKVLIVEDNPARHDYFSKVYAGHDIVHAVNYSQAAQALSENAFDIIQLDHDLGDFQIPEYSTYQMYGQRELTGYDVALYLVYNVPQNMWPKKVIIHSVNPNGANFIALLLEKNGIGYVKQPFIIQE